MEIKLVETEAELQHAYRVRTLVFVEEQGVSEEEEIDDLENEAIHFVGYHDSKPIAASRMRFVDQQYAKLERICILKEERGKGFGRYIILFMENLAKSKGYKQSKLNGQTYAESFYQRLGYKTVSGEFTDAGIPHVAMQKTL